MTLLHPGSALAKEVAFVDHHCNGCARAWASIGWKACLVFFLPPQTVLRCKLETSCQFHCLLFPTLCIIRAPLKRKGVCVSLFLIASCGAGSHRCLYPNKGLCPRAKPLKWQGRRMQSGSHAGSCPRTCLDPRCPMARAVGIENEHQN